MSAAKQRKMYKPKLVTEADLLAFQANGDTILGRSSDGEEFIGSTSDYYLKPKLDGGKLRDLQDNYFVASGYEDLSEKLFTGEPQIHYYDENDEEDPELNRKLEQIMAKCDFDAKIRISHSDIWHWGPFLMQPEWGQTEDGWVAPLYLKRLPPESFIEAPSPAPPTYTYSEILKGICKNEKGEIEFWQLQTDGKAHLLKNVVMFRDPKRPQLAGKSRLIPLAPLITLASFCLKATHQRVNRIGAPALFIHFLGPPQKIGTTNEIEIARNILRNWGKDTAHMLTPNMKIVELTGADNRSANDTIELLDRLIRRYFNLSTMMEKEGSTMGGNAAAQAGLVSTSIQSILRWLAKLWIPILEEMMKRNGFSGGRIELVLPVPEPDRTEVDLRIAEVGDRIGALTLNEKRELLGRPEATPEILEEIESERKAKAPPPNPFGAPPGAPPGPPGSPPNPQQKEGQNPNEPQNEEGQPKSFQEYYKFAHDKEHEPTQLELELAKELEEADQRCADKIAGAVKKEKAK